MLRYESIEQTNNQYNITLQLQDFVEKGSMLYKLYRNRSLGEFTMIYQSEKRKNNPPQGAQWKTLKIPAKELCRNDTQRILKLEIY